MNPSELVKMVVSTLNTVEVKGKSNMDALLGSINALETVVQVLESPVPPDDVKKEEEDG